MCWFSSPLSNAFEFVSGFNVMVRKSFIGHRTYELGMHAYGKHIGLFQQRLAE